MLQSMGSQESDMTWQLNNNSGLREVLSLARALDASFEKDTVCTKDLRVSSSSFFYQKICNGLPSELGIYSLKKHSWHFVPNIVLDNVKMRKTKFLSF